MTSSEGIENSSEMFVKDGSDTAADVNVHGNGNGDGNLFSAGCSSSSSAIAVMPSPDQQPIVLTDQAVPMSPAFGVMSIAGMRLRPMEDTVAVHPNLCSPEVNSNKPVHYFAVFDGHGSSHVATLCRDHMHLILVEELACADSFFRSYRGAGGLPEGISKVAWKKALKNCFKRMDMLATNPTIVCGNAGCRCPTAAKYSGSTAVVVVVADDQIVVAHVGDSRAVICRRGFYTNLTTDHKPNRKDEQTRIESLGGHVICTRGDIPRVEGVLAMSRAIGDMYLKPMVIAEPEITFKRRTEDNEFMIIASDGLWDVVTSQMACKVARVCHRAEEHPPNHSLPYEEAYAPLFPSPSAASAEVLTHLALVRHSHDNISVVVVDLERNQVCGTSG